MQYNNTRHSSGRQRCNDDTLSVYDRYASAVQLLAPDLVRSRGSTRNNTSYIRIAIQNWQKKLVKSTRNYPHRKRHPGFNNSKIQREPRITHLCCPPGSLRCRYHPPYQRTPQVKTSALKPWLTSCAARISGEHCNRARWLREQTDGCADASRVRALSGNEGAVW